MRNTYLCLLALVGSLSLVGCNRGFISADAMASGEIGPTNCAATCEDNGLRMGAFVLVQHSYAGCVCVPPETAGGATAGAAAVNAGAVLAVGEARRREQEQAQRQQQQQN